MGYGHDFGMVGYGLGGFGWLAGLLVLVLLVLGAVYLFRALDRDRPSRTPPAQTPPPPRDNALAILRERYARGEIDHDEFQRRKEDLS